MSGTSERAGIWISIKIFTRGRREIRRFRGWLIRITLVICHRRLFHNSIVTLEKICATKTCKVSNFFARQRVARFSVPSTCSFKWMEIISFRQQQQKLSSLQMSDFLLFFPLQRLELPRFDGALGCHRLTAENPNNPRLRVCWRGWSHRRRRRGVQGKLKVAARELTVFNLFFHSQVGDRVVALPEFRAWAELCAVPTKYVYKLPDEISFHDAAAITMNYLVAYIIVFELLSLRSGKSLMLHSAGGGVVSTNKVFNFNVHLRDCFHGDFPSLRCSHDFSLPTSDLTFTWNKT